MKLAVPVNEIQRWKPDPGDVLIVRNTEVMITNEQSAEIKELVRRSLDLDSNVKIMVVGRDWEVSVGKVPGE